MALVTMVVYWFVAGKERYANTCYSDGEAAMNVGIYPQANHYFENAIRYTNAPITLSNQIKRVYLAHLHTWEQRGDYPKAERVGGFLLQLFPKDEAIKRTVEELSILLSPSNDLQVRLSKVYPGVNGRFLKNGNLLLEDFRERLWILDPEKSVTRRVFPIRNEVFLAASPTARFAAVVLEAQEGDKTGKNDKTEKTEKDKKTGKIKKGVLGFLNQDGLVVTKTNVIVSSESGCTWSPDETTVAVDALSPTGERFICLVDAATGETKQFKGEGVFPSWSPLGDAIAFVGASSSLMINNVQGDTTREIASLSSFQEPPVWSPKGDAVSIRLKKGTRAFSLDGTPLFALEETLTDPAWAPNGSRLAAVVPKTKEICLLDRKGKVGKIPTTLPITGCEWSTEGSKLALNYDDGTDRFLNLVSLGKKPQAKPKSLLPTSN
ncbi:MAG: TolB family protein [Bacteroidota bacterium]